MEKLAFTTTGCWDDAVGFGCASLGLPGLCDNSQSNVTVYSRELDAVRLTGSYESILAGAKTVAAAQQVYAAVVLFGNAGGENAFLAQLQEIVPCPMVGGAAAIDAPSGRKALLSGGGTAAVLLITDDRYTYVAETKCIHDEILETCTLTTADPRTILTINGVDAAQYLAEKKRAFSLADSDFEHLTLSDSYNINAHLSVENGVLKSGRDVPEQMLLRYVSHEKVYEAMRSFYDDPDAIVFGCAGLSGILDAPLDTCSLGLFLFGEVCTVDGHAEFGNLMLSKLRILEK